MACRSALIRGLLLSATAFSPALAQEALAQEALAQEALAFGEPLTLDPVVLRAADEFGFAADRGAAAYVSPADIERARTGTLRDLFAGTSSVSVGGGIPVAQKIYVNGIDMLALSVQVDGVLQNNRTFHHASSNAFDPGLLKSVRVDPGVAAADLGPNALAGGVIFETVDAADVLAEGESFGGTLRTGYETNGQTLTGSATLAGRQGAFDWLIYGRSSTGEDYKTGAGDVQAGTAADLSNLLIKGGVVFGQDQDQRLEFSAQELGDDALRPYRANMVGIIGRPMELRRYDTTRRNYALNYETIGATGPWDPRATVGFSESRVNLPDPYGSQGTTNTWSARVENVFHLRGTDTVNVGLDAYDRMARYVGSYELGGVRYNDFAEETATNLGIFAQARLEPGERWKLSFGGRADRQDFEGVNGWTDTSSGLSGNVSLGYALTEALTLRAGYSDVFGGISIEDSYVFLPSWTYADLRAARGQNRILGFDYQAEGALAGLRISAEYFRTDLSDVRSGETVVDVESEGFNLGLGVNWGAGGLRASYTRADLTVNGDVTGSYYLRNLGTPLGDVIKLEAQQRLAGTAVTLGGSIDAALRYEDVDRAESSALPGYAVFNVFAEWEPEPLPNLVLRAEVRNMFDRDYSDRATYGQDYPAGPGGVEPMREPGRSLSLVASYRF